MADVVDLAGGADKPQLKLTPLPNSGIAWLADFPTPKSRRSATLHVSLAPIEIAGSAVVTLPQDIAAMAESIVNTLTQTDYQHADKIGPSTGVYDCDCNGLPLSS